MLSLASSRAQWEQKGNQWMQPHSVSLSETYSVHDMNHRLKHVLLHDVTLMTRDQDHYIGINVLKDNYCTHWYVLPVCLCLSFSLIQT